MDFLRKSSAHATRKGTIDLSHIVEIKTEVRDAVAVRAACGRLKLEAPVQGSAQLFSGTATGLIVNLPDWKYPAVFDTESGHARFDNYNGAWGDQAELNKFSQAYACEKDEDALAATAQLCRQESWRLATWNVAVGLRVMGAEANAGASDRLAAIQAVSSLATPEGTAILVLENFHRFTSPEIVQMLAEQIVAGKQNRTFILVLSPVVQIPIELSGLSGVLHGVEIESEGMRCVGVECVDVLHDGLLKTLDRLEEIVADGRSLEVSPEPLDQVQVGCIRGVPDDLHMITTVVQELANAFRVMNRTVVHQQRYLFAMSVMTEQILQEV